MKAALLLFALLLIAFSAHAEWGRLFYSPQERQQLNRQSSSPATLHRLDGEARRHGGRTLRWIDGQPSASRPPAQVRPGDRWDAETGHILRAP